MSNKSIDFLNIPVDNFKQILYHLDGKDYVNLLICCKDWNRFLLPLIWEDIEPKSYCFDNKRRVRAYKYYGRYIKYLNLSNDPELPIRRSIFPNAAHLNCSISTYLKNLVELIEMKLTATILDDELDDMNLVEYVFVNEMSLEHLLSNLTYLEIPYIYDYFKSIVMPTLPPSMHSLYLGSTDDNDPFFESLLTRLTNLKRLGLEYTSLNEQDYTYFKATRFTTLVSLALCHVELDDNILIINFDNFPNLKDLVIAENGEIQFIGVSKITALTISDLGFKLNTLKVDQFPELRILKVKHFYNLRVQQLRELFSFPNLTSLTIKTYSCDLLLLQEVFIKQNTNLIKLKIHGFSLGSYFYNFITKHCPNLMVYILNRCEFIDDIKFNRKNVNLNLNLIEIANCEEGYGFNEHVKWLLENSKNLKKIIIDDTNLPFNLIDKYSNIIEFDA